VASSISALAAAGSLSIFCWASPSVIPTDTSRGWTPSWRSRSMRVRSSSPERTALALRAGRAGLLHEHRLTARHEDRPGEHRMQERGADQQREADDDAHDADRDGRLDADLHIRGGDARGILADQRCEAAPRSRTAPTIGSTMSPRIVEMPAEATPRHMGPSVNCCQSVRSHPENPGGRCGAPSARAGRSRRGRRPAYSSHAVAHVA
jgi:hypothetical protein